MFENKIDQVLERMLGDSKRVVGYAIANPPYALEGRRVHSRVA